jgi:type VI secretion system protein
MSLTLHVISHQRASLGEKARFVFNPGTTGTANIGRLEDNDWSLPDPQRLVSGHHARIHVREGRYFIEDTSTNGVFTERGARQIPRSTLHPLRDGDVLQLGEYHLRVRIDEISATQQLRDWAGEVEALSGTGNFPASQLTALRFLADDDDLAPAMLLDDLLGRGGGLSANEAQLDRPDPPHAHLHYTDPAAERQRTFELLDEGSLRPLERRAALQGFCRGAGLDISQLPPESDNRLMMLVGQMLREALGGMTELQRLQQQGPASGSFRTVPSAQAASQTAATELALTEQLLKLLNGHERRELDAVRRIRDAFASLRTHQQALQARSNALT